MKRICCYLLSTLLVTVLAISFIPVQALAASSPYYTDIEISNISSSNAIITATLKNPSKDKLVEGGFYIARDLGDRCELATKKTDKIARNWQQKESLPCSYDLKNEYNLQLKADSSYLVTLYVKDSKGNYYESETVSFKTSELLSLNMDAPFHQNAKGESADFDYPNSSCYVNSFAMVFQMLGNEDASPTAIYKFNGNTVYTKGTSAVAKEFGFKAIRADKLAEYKDFKKLSADEQEELLKEALSEYGVCNLNVFSKTSGQQIHMAMAYMDENDNILVRDPGLSADEGCDISYSDFASQIKEYYDKTAYVYNFWYFVEN